MQSTACHLFILRNLRFGSFAFGGLFWLVFVFQGNLAAAHAIVNALLGCADHLVCTMFGCADRFIGALPGSRVDFLCLGA